MADNLGVSSHPGVDPNDLPRKARQIVFDHVVAKNLDKTDDHSFFDVDHVYVVWFAFTLGNWKALLSTTLFDGKYYEVTFNNNKGQAYIDTYVKVDNIALEL